MSKIDFNIWIQKDGAKIAIKDMSNNLEKELERRQNE